MINIKPITDAYLYTIGTWTSQILYNEDAGFPTGITSEWGYLKWDEENTGTGYTGQIRIDILKASDSSVLVADIAKNSDGSPTDVSTYITTNDIKIKVKLYGLDYPTPAVKNLRIKHKNWNQEQVVTNLGKNLLLNRALISPSTTAVHTIQVGNSQSTQFTENSTGLANVLTTQHTSGAFTTITFNETERLVEIEFALNNSDVIIPNKTIMNSIGVSNDDSSPLFVAGSRFYDIYKDTAANYTFKIAFRVYPSNTSVTMFNRTGENILLQRAFTAVPTYAGINNCVCGYQSDPLTDTMTALSSTYFGPDTFQYVIMDTSKIKLTLSMLLDISEGNGYNYNVIGHLNNDSTKQFMFAGVLDETVTKTSTYIYNFNTNYSLLTPISTLL